MSTISKCILVPTGFSGLVFVGLLRSERGSVIVINENVLKTLKEWVSLHVFSDGMSHSRGLSQTAGSHGSLRELVTMETGQFHHVHLDVRGVTR